MSIKVIFFKFTFKQNDIIVNDLNVLEPSTLELLVYHFANECDYPNFKFL
jgi:hypothetical protein